MIGVRSGQNMTITSVAGIITANRSVTVVTVIPYCSFSQKYSHTRRCRPSLPCQGGRGGEISRAAGQRRVHNETKGGTMQIGSPMKARGRVRRFAHPHWRGDAASGGNHVQPGPASDSPSKRCNLHLARSDAAQKLKVSPHHVALTAKAATAGNDYQCNPGGIFEPELRVAV